MEGEIKQIFYITCRLWSCGRWRIRGSGMWYEPPVPHKAIKTIKYCYCDKHEEEMERK